MVKTGSFQQGLATRLQKELTSSLMGVKEIELLWCMVMISSLKSSSDTISDVPRIDFMSDSVCTFQIHTMWSAGAEVMRMSFV